MYNIYRKPGVANNWLVTVAIGSPYLENFEKFALPTWTKYCDRYDLGILAVTQQLIDKSDFWKKAKLAKVITAKISFENVKDIDAVCYLDTDILINPFAPNVF